MNHFFANSDYLDRLALRPLSHIRHNWELTWDSSTMAYRPEPDSFADLLNSLMHELRDVDPPARYHDNEDRLAEYLRDRFLKWEIRKVRNRWVGANYVSILEQGGFDDIDQTELVLAAAGRIRAARARGQDHFDEMEKSHREMLAAVMAVILYHRSCRPEMDADTTI